MIRNISFDLWGTLIEPNPEYSKIRQEYLCDLQPLMSPPLIREIYHNTKRYIDNMNEATGIAFSSENCYRLLLRNLNLKTDIALDVQDHMNRVFLEYPPIVLASTREAVKWLSLKYGIAICSNTNFISGRMLNRFLHEEFGDVWSYAKFFSDELKYAKPYLLSLVAGDVLGNLTETYVHIGDNRVCDYEGAKKAGMKAILINSPKCITNLPSMIDSLQKEAAHA